MTERFEPGTIAFVDRVKKSAKPRPPAPVVLHPATDGGFIVYALASSPGRPSEALFAGSLDDVLRHLKLRFTGSATITHQGGAEITIRGLPNGAISKSVAPLPTDCGCREGIACSLPDCPRKIRG